MTDGIGSPRPQIRFASNSIGDIQYMGGNATGIFWQMHRKIFGGSLCDIAIAGERGSTDKDLEQDRGQLVAGRDGGNTV
jgi:hypothetical protein